MYRRIRDLREDRDLLQRDLAAYLQCSQVCYSHYEMGKRDIPTDVLISWPTSTTPAPTTSWPAQTRITLPKAPGLWSPIAYFLL